MRVFAVCLVACALMGQAKPHQQTATAPDAPRYQLVHLGEARADQYLVDTHTGRVWQVVQAKAGGLVLQSVPFVHLNGQSYELPEDIGTLEQSIKARKADFWLELTGAKKK